MKIRREFILAIVLGLALSPAVFADDNDATLDVVEVDGTSEDFVNTIALPEEAADEGHDNAAFGIDTANEAREYGREFGERIADDARSGDVSEQIRDSVQDARNNVPEPPRP
jgi:hypothetical protein